MTRLSRLVTTVVLIAAGAGALPAGAAPADAPPLPSTLVVSAHRGGAAYAPEDTMYAYRNAVRLGADQLETDTTLTKDGVLVLIHDATLDRTTNCTGRVSDYTFADLEQKCDAGWWWTPGQSTTTPDDEAPHPLRGIGVKVPAARQLFRFVRSLGPDDHHTINIEIKDANFKASADALVALIQHSGLKERTIVQSFYPPALTYVKSLDPTITTALLTLGTSTPYFAYAVAGGHEWLSPSESDADLNAATVAAEHAAGKKIIPWTVDTAADMTTIGGYGVDALITNYPACLLRLEGRPVPAGVLPKRSVAAGATAVRACPSSTDASAG